MKCKPSRSTFKPQLEELEERANPSFLLGGNTVQQMAQPLNNVVADMKTTLNDLTSALNTGNSAANNSTLQGKAFVVAVSDFQRLLAEQQAVQAFSAAEQKFINTVALAEFQAGDATDLFVLYFGKFLNLDPVSSLTDPVDQANGLMQSSSEQADFNLMQTDSLFGIKLIQYTQTPSF